MPYAGTIVNASEDVLSALLDGNGAVRVPARRQQDVVALVKTVYALVRPHCVPKIQNLAVLVAQDLALDTAEARERAVTRVRTFWDEELHPDSAAGRKWRRLVKIAHVDEPAAAIAYSEAMQNLREELEVLL